MKEKPVSASDSISGLNRGDRRIWPDTYLAMIPCLAAVLALSGVATSNSIPQQSPHGNAPETTASQTASPHTQISHTAPEKTAAAETKSEAAPTRVSPPQANQATSTQGQRATAPVEPSQVSLDLPAQSKIISVEKLQLPPVSKPLPDWMQKAVVPADNPNINQAQLAKSTSKSTFERFAQLPSTKPALGNNAQPAARSASTHLPNQITVAASTYVVLMANTDLQTVAVADPAIADVSVVNARAVLVNGKSAGNTTLVIIDKVGKIRQYDIDVTPAPGARPQDIEAAIGIDGLHVRQLRDTIVLEGEVNSNDEIQQAVQIAGIYAPKVLNLLQVQGALSGPAGTAAQIQNAINQPDVRVSMLSDTAILQGTVSTSAQREQAEKVAQLLAPKVLNLLQLPPLTVDEVKSALGAVDQQPDIILPASGSFGSLSPQPYLIIRQQGDQLILEGYEPANFDVASALATASRTGLQVVNRLRLAPAPGEDQQLLNTIASAIGIPGVRVRGTAKRVVLEGVVPDTNAAVAAGQIALSYASDVDNMLQTQHPIQVNVDVSLVEISKNNIKALGINGPDDLLGTDGSSSGGLSIGGIGIGQATTLGTNLGLQLKAAIDDGDANLLSNPRTTVLSGRTASFQAGGQFPIPTSVSQTNTGTLVQVEYKDFGVMMDVTPIANKDGTVTMRVRTDVTQIDPTVGSVQIADGVSVPAFTRRAAITEVTVPPGGSIALSGLLQTTLRKYIRKVPVLSKIPILGKLFSSTRYENGESDLVIFVTPRVLPNPLPEGSEAPAAVTAVGPNTTASVTLGNSGISTFEKLGQSNASSGGGQQ